MKTLTGRNRYQCTGCGLRLEGRENSRGEIVAYDRSPANDEPVKPTLCVSCANPERVSAVIAATKETEKSE